MDQPISLHEMNLRSLYMRLYRSYRDGEPYLHDFAGPEIQYLLDACHAVEEPGGYRLTLDGVKAWANMNRYILAGSLNLARNVEHSILLKELRSHLSDYSEDTMSKLIVELKHFLEKVDSHIPTVVRGADKTVLMTAIRQKYAEKVGDHLYCITDAGRAWLEENGAPVQPVTMPVTEINQNALIHRLLAGQSIMRAELTTKEEQEFFRRLVRDVHVTVSGDAYVITKAGRAALEEFGEPAPVVSEPEAEPPVETAFSEPEPEPFIQEVPADVTQAKPVKRPYTRRQPRPAIEPVTSATIIQNSTTEIQTNIPGTFGGGVVPVQPEPVAHHCEGKDCLPCRVLAAVMDRVPEVKDLYEAMHAQDVILSSLGKR